ncbi:T9SS type A sorting domain-containing protein [Chitinophagaceae bacterium MMS25-I14]
MPLLSTQKNYQRKIKNSLLLLAFALGLGSEKGIAQVGTWTQVAAPCNDTCAGVMLLLSDGSVIAKSKSGIDHIGNSWQKLTPDIHGSYINGTWSSIASMMDSRLYFSSQVLKDGRVYVAGGEYGTGGSRSEIYNPLTDTWTAGPFTSVSRKISDANSEQLPDGRILQAIVNSFTGNVIYNPATNTYSAAPSCLQSHDESSWLKLPDNSILFVDFDTTSSERYIPSLNQWVADATVPVPLYDTSIGETGPSFLLPDGRGFFIGANGKTAFYTPSGTTSPGTWAAGPDIPHGLGAPDAAAAMMANGKILCAFSPPPTDSINFADTTYFFEFNYVTDSFVQIPTPMGGPYMNVPAYFTNMLDLPDGSVLFANLYDNTYYTYTPSGAPLAAGKPTVSGITTTDCHTYRIIGTLFNGISKGACYGDDWQMATNYPLVRLRSGSNVYYARTFNWNRTGVQTGALPDTASFTLPAAFTPGTYSLEVVVNGISSDPSSFTACPEGINEQQVIAHSFTIYPNPTNGTVTISGENKADEINITNTIGQSVYQAKPGGRSVSVKLQQPGIYFVTISSDNIKTTQTLVVE